VMFRNTKLIVSGIPLMSWLGLIRSSTFDCLLAEVWAETISEDRTSKFIAVTQRMLHFQLSVIAGTYDTSLNQRLD